MSKILPAPIYTAVIDQDGKATLPWITFFNQLYVGDTGTPQEGSGSWTPTFVGLTQVGTATITGKLFKLTQHLAYFYVKITPGTSVTATAGTTYIDNLPLDVFSDGACFALSGLLGSVAGVIENTTNRVYIPSLAAVTVPVYIVGFCEGR